MDTKRSAVRSIAWLDAAFISVQMNVCGLLAPPSRAPLRVWPDHPTRDDRLARRAVGDIDRIFERTLSHEGLRPIDTIRVARYDDIRFPLWVPREKCGDGVSMRSDERHAMTGAQLLTGLGWNRRMLGQVLTVHAAGEQETASQSGC